MNKLLKFGSFPFVISVIASSLFFCPSAQSQRQDTVANCQKLLAFINDPQTNGMAQRITISTYNQVCQNPTQNATEPSEDERRYNEALRQRVQEGMVEMRERNRYLNEDQNCLIWGRGTYNPSTRSCNR